MARTITGMGLSGRVRVWPMARAITGLGCQEGGLANG